MLKAITVCGHGKNQILFERLMDIFSMHFPIRNEIFFSILLKKA